MDRLSATLPAHKSAFFSASVPLRARAVAPPPRAASPSALPPISNIFFLRPRAPPPPPPPQEPPSTGKVPAPGRYGGAPLDKRIRQTWGGKEEDPLESGEYIWNTEWKKTVTVDDADKNKAAAEDPIASAVSSNDPGTSNGGFLSLGRSLALDSMDVDLSAELSRPSKATLEKQVEAARRAAGMQAQQGSSEGKIKWRYAPTSKEERQWAEANKRSAKMVTAFVEKEEPLTPEQIAQREKQQYEKLKQSLLLTTLGLGVVFTGTAAVLYSPEVAVSYGVGAVGSLVYVRMLSSSVEALGANNVQGAVRGAVGQPRLLVPVVLVMAFNRWNEIAVPQYGAVPLELIPMLVGFFTVLLRSRQSGVPVWFLLPFSHSPSVTTPFLLPPLLLSSLPPLSLLPPSSFPPFPPLFLLPFVLPFLLHYLVPSSPLHAPPIPSSLTRTLQPSARLPCLTPSEAVQLLTKGRARDIRILHVAGRCQWAEHLVLATAHSTRHARGLAAGLAYELKQRYVREGMAARAPEVEGKEAEHWMLLDCGRTVVHVMTEEGRRRYKLGRRERPTLVAVVLVVLVIACIARRIRAAATEPIREAAAGTTAGTAAGAAAAGAALGAEAAWKQPLAEECAGGVGAMPRAQVGAGTGADIARNELGWWARGAGERRRYLAGVGCGRREGRMLHEMEEGGAVVGRVAALEDELNVAAGGAAAGEAAAGEAAAAGAAAGGGVAGGGQVLQQPPLQAAPRAAQGSSENGSVAGGGTPVESAGGEEGRGSGREDEGRMEGDGTDRGSADSSAAGSIKLDWTRPLTMKQRVELDQRKVDRGVCSGTVRYDNQYGRGHMAWIPLPGRYVLMDCHRNQVGQASEAIAWPLANGVRVTGYRLSSAGLTLTALCLSPPPTLVTLAIPSLVCPSPPVLMWQLSNRVRCIRNYLTLTGYLNRTLVVPLHAADASSTGGNTGNSSSSSSSTTPVADSHGNRLSYDRRVFFDVAHAQLCFGPTTVMTPLQVLLRLQGDNGTHGMGSTMMDASRSPQGEYMNGLDVPFFSLDGCNNRLAIQPHPAVLAAADAFVRRVVLGGRAREWEVASGDNSSDSAYKKAGHVSAQQAGLCVAHKMQRSYNTTALFLATDAGADEISDLEQSIRSVIPSLQLFQLPQEFTEQPWAEVLLPFHFEHLTTVRATLDKAVCAMADVFLGTKISSFSQDIFRIRSGLRYNACDDSTVCADETSNKT
ncbi:unnamed protein product [Closterium sp. Yama58-4]|nr:unnamed protein product [Closterium sp. Yama58-4]